MSVKAWEDGPSYIDMPRRMDSYSAPAMPDPETMRQLDGARETMRWLEEALSEPRDGTRPVLADLSGLDADSREVVHQVLGEGEVSISVSGEANARVQESVLAGVWRILHLDDEGRVVADLLEVGPYPYVLSVAFEDSRPLDTTAGGDVAGMANAMPILVELAEAVSRYAADGTEHSINFSLLPTTDEELAFIEARLGRGPVNILSQAYGKCQVISTGTPNAWWVRYYNGMDKLILNSLEVVAVPGVVCAAEEDLRDSAARLQDILAPYRQDEA
jgi:hydrogenase-1 operon protein HyaF